MRNGNPFTIPSKLSGYSVLTVPMRNGNEMLKNYDCKPSEFLPYLWGMETPLQYHQNFQDTVSSYRTYEEWKHNTASNIIIASKVLTVPMRNGNPFPLFLPSYSNLVLTVPMRNGNSSPYRLDRVLSKVLTVPMRNGNLEGILYQPGFYVSSYRTYEEWKPRPWKVYALKLLCSYRTYEEWKPRDKRKTIFSNVSSYRTYEEWKHNSSDLFISSSPCSYRTYEEWKL